MGLKNYEKNYEKNYYISKQEYIYQDVTIRQQS